MEYLFFELLQVALGIREGLSRRLTDEEWRKVYEEATRQSLTGVLFCAVERMPKDWRPETDLMMEWYGWTAQIEEMNRLMNREAAWLTRLFEQEGHRTAILKGQANARLYETNTDGTDGTERRQPGDIDIWVDGGKEKVVETLIRTGLIDGRDYLAEGFSLGKATTSYHHIHLPENEQGITVEVHFRPSSGNYNPITNRRLQKWLEREIENRTEVKEGFNVPSTAFALVMQLAHIQRHFMSSGIGMRQVMDYYYLLKSNTDCTDITDNKSHTESTEITENVRNTDSTDITDNIRNTDNTDSTEKVLKHLGLEEMAGAMMWVLGEVMMLDERLMICKPDARRGEWLLQDMMAGGNFGHYANASDGLWRRFFKARLRHLKMIRFNFWEGIWAEIFFWKDFVKRIPLRMKYRTWSLNRNCSVKPVIAI